MLLKVHLEVGLGGGSTAASFQLVLRASHLFWLSANVYLVKAKTPSEIGLQSRPVYLESFVK